MMKNIKCKHCNNLRNHWCEKVVDSPDEELLRDCQHFWEITNADRIRAMSNEELAEQLVSYRGGVYDDYITHAGAFYEWEDAVEAEAQWLKQPVEDEQ